MEEDYKALQAAYLRAVKEHRRHYAEIFYQAIEAFDADEPSTLLDAVVSLARTYGEV